MFKCSPVPASFFPYISTSLQRRLKLKLIKYILIQQKAHLFDQEPRWLEKGEKNTSYKRQMISSLKIDDVITSNPKVISNYVESFYSQLSKSV